MSIRSVCCAVLLSWAFGAGCSSKESGDQTNAATAGMVAVTGGTSGAGLGGVSGAIGTSTGGASGSVGAAGAAGTAGSGGMTVTGGVGGTAAGTSGMDAADAGDDDASMAGSGAGPSLPPVTDYAAPGPFDDAMMVQRVGPNSNCTLYRPGASLGRDGFKHPIAAWGNGITTTPDMYEETLTLVATHGFVIIATNDTTVEEPAVTTGIEWLIEQNQAAGDLQGMLDTTREVMFGYSWGGGAAIDTSNRPNVIATISMHGMPPRRDDAFETMHAPLLLFTSTGDTFVTAEMHVTPTYENSQVQTFYATLDDATAGHLYVVDEGAGACVGSVIGLGACKGAIAERAPVIAWLRYWVYGDEGARAFFFGDDCTLCANGWATPQRKMWP